MKRIGVIRISMGLAHLTDPCNPSKVNGSNGEKGDPPTLGFIGYKGLR